MVSVQNKDLKLKIPAWPGRLEAVLLKSLGPILLSDWSKPGEVSEAVTPLASMELC